MDEETQARHTALKVTLAEREQVFAAVAAENGALVTADSDEELPSPSRADKKAMRDRVVEAEAQVDRLREEIRKIEWAEAAVEEGEPLVLGVDNVRQFREAAAAEEH